MKLTLALSLLLVATASSADPFADGNAKTGQKLFEQHNCNRCHAKIVGGGGNAIFTRTNRKVHDVPGLLEQMDACGGAAGVTLSPQDKQHLGAYLNRYYSLK